jgi:hypothetical protein
MLEEGFAEEAGGSEVQQQQQQLEGGAGSCCSFYLPQQQGVILPGEQQSFRWVRDVPRGALHYIAGFLS